jgi:hypothetical protein
MLEPIPGEKFAASDWNDVYLKPGKHPRRVDIEHEVYQESAVEAWRAALEETKTYGTKFGHAGTPNRKG